MTKRKNLNRDFTRDLKSIRVRYWFAGLRLRFKVPGLDALAALIEPELRWPSSNSGGTGRPNKFRGYSQGVRTPRMALVLKVEALRGELGSGAGSAAEFQHVLWDILANRTPSPSTVARWIQRLSPRARQTLMSAPHIPVKAMFGLGVPMLRGAERERLIHVDPMDALAVWVLAMQQAHRFGLDDLAYSSGQGVVRQLWHLSLDLGDRGLALPMFELFERWVLPQACEKGKYASLGGLVPERLTTLFDAVRKRMAWDRRPRSAKNSAIYLRKVVDHSFTLSMVFHPVDAAIPGSSTSEDEPVDADQKMEERYRQLLKLTPKRFGHNSSDWP